MKDRIKDTWLLERINALYPDFKNGISRIIYSPVGVSSVIFLDYSENNYGIERKIDLKDSFLKDPSILYRDHYVVGFKYGTLCIHDYSGMQI